MSAKDELTVAEAAFAQALRRRQNAELELQELIAAEMVDYKELMMLREAATREAHVESDKSVLSACAACGRCLDCCSRFIAQ